MGTTILFPRKEMIFERTTSQCGKMLIECVLAYFEDIHRTFHFTFAVFWKFVFNRMYRQFTLWWTFLSKPTLDNFSSQSIDLIIGSICILLAKCFYVNRCVKRHFTHQYVFLNDPTTSTHNIILYIRLVR